MRGTAPTAVQIDPQHADLHRAVDESVPLAMNESADILVWTMASFDMPTAEHLEAVGVLSMHLALELGFSYRQAAIAKLAGRTHDIGKLAISRSVLLKPDKLTDEEWQDVRMHPHYGAVTLAGIPALAELAPYVHAHHERFDGRGYPNGRTMSDILPAAQVISICDAFHAMTVSRPYSPPRLPGDAIAELLRSSGTQFCSDYVDAFVAMMGRRGLSYLRSKERAS